MFEIKYMPYFSIKNDSNNGLSADYEITLMGFLRWAKNFKKRVNCQSFTHSKEQSNSECDCVGENYQLDFKLFVSSSLMEKKSYYAPSIDRSHMSQGYISVNTNRSPMEDFSKLDLLSKILGLSYDKLYAAYYGNENIDKDIKSHFKVIGTPKNIMLYLPYEIKSDLDDNFISETMCSLLKNICMLRSTINDFDTFIGVVINDIFYIFEFAEGHIAIIDKVHVILNSDYSDIKLYALY